MSLRLKQVEARVVEKERLEVLRRVRRQPDTYRPAEGVPQQDSQPADDMGKKRGDVAGIVSEQVAALSITWPRPASTSRYSAP